MVLVALLTPYWIVDKDGRHYGLIYDCAEELCIDRLIVLSIFSSVCNMLSRCRFAEANDMTALKQVLQYTLKHMFAQKIPYSESSYCVLHVSTMLASNIRPPSGDAGATIGVGVTGIARLLPVAVRPPRLLVSGTGVSLRHYHVRRHSRLHHRRQQC